MVEDSYKASYKPKPRNVKEFFETSNVLVQETNDEKTWYESLCEKAMDWLR